MPCVPQPSQQAPVQASGSYVPPPAAAFGLAAEQRPSFTPPPVLLQQTPSYTPPPADVNAAMTGPSMLDQRQSCVQLPALFQQTPSYTPLPVLPPPPLNNERPDPRPPSMVPPRYCCAHNTSEKRAKAQPRTWDCTTC